MLTPLLNTALLGTTKQPYRPDAATPAALQTAWAALADSSAERRTYRYAALAFACAYGGQTPAQSADGWQLIPPAPAAEVAGRVSTGPAAPPARSTSRPPT